LDYLEILYVVWAFFFQMVLIVHFAIRKKYYQVYTIRFGWVVYALSIPAAIISVVILLGGKTWSFWLGGFLFLVYASYGYWIDYVKKLQWRNPLRLSIMFPYVFLYLGTAMFYWWPLAELNRIFWFVFTVLFIVGIILNIKSH